MNNKKIEGSKDEERKKVPFGIRLIAITWCFAGLIGGIVVIEDITDLTLIFHRYDPIAAGLRLALSFCLFVVSYGLWKLKRWARVSFFVTYIFFSLSWLIWWWGIVFIVIGVFSIIYLMKPNIRALYAEDEQVLRRERLRLEQVALDKISNTGELPIIKVEILPKYLALILKKDELLYLWRDTITLFQKKSQSHLVGGGSLEPNIPNDIKGVRIHPQDYSGKIRNIKKILEPIDTGNLILTNKRLIFEGREKSIRAPLKEIRDVDVIEGLVSVAREGKERIELFETTYPTFTAVAVIVAVQKAT